MPREDSPAALTDDDRGSADDDLLQAQERHRAVQRALADALQLARLQVEVLVRLDEADRAGDDEAVLRCHAELDHVVALMAEAEEIRTGARAALSDGNDLICAGCGAAAEPVYATPRLLAYRCSRCGWTGDDPAAQAERRRAEAKDAAVAVVERAVDGVGNALAILDHRGKKAREEGISALRLLREDLAAVDDRLRRTKLSGPWGASALASPLSSSPRSPSTAPEQDARLAGCLVNSTRQVGSAIGLAVLATTAASVSGGSLRPLRVQADRLGRPGRGCAGCRRPRRRAPGRG